MINHIINDPVLQDNSPNRREWKKSPLYVHATTTNERTRKRVVVGGGKSAAPHVKQKRKRLLWCVHCYRHRSLSKQQQVSGQAGRQATTTVQLRGAGPREAQAAPVGVPAAGWPKLRVLGSRHTTSHRAGPLFIQLQTRQQSLPQISNPRTNLFPKIVKTIIIQHM